MNSQLADVAMGDSPSSAPGAMAATTGPARVLLTLARRELWEHRALWIAPLVIAVLAGLCAIPAHVDSDAFGHAARLSVAERQQAMFTLLQWGLSVPVYAVTLVVVPFYLLDCLYTERKDRSILFWKSLPVSDGLTVLSKLLVALVIVPLAVFVLALAAHLVFSSLWQLRVALGSAPAGVLVWNTLLWGKLEMAMFLGLVLAVLWYAPFAAYLLLVSAWARRGPFVWALAPVVLAPLLERIAFGTSYVWHLLRYRFGGIWWTLFSGPGESLHHTHISSPAQVLDKLNFAAAFADIDLWLGVALAAALVYAAIRLRRYRDET